MQAHGAEPIGQMQYENSYRLAYIRGAEVSSVVGLAEQLGYGRAARSLARTTITAQASIAQASTAVP